MATLEHGRIGMSVQAAARHTVKEENRRSGMIAPLCEPKAATVLEHNRLVQRLGV